MEEFQRFLEGSREGMGWADLDGVIRYANAALVHMIGVDREAILGRPVTELYDPETRRRLAEEIFPAVRREGSWRGELVLQTSTGPLPTMNHLFALRDSAGDPIAYANVVENLSSSGSVELELRRQQDRLERLVAERTAALSAAVEELRREIAERERGEQEIARGKAFLEAVILQSPIPMVLVSFPDMVVRLHNSACREILGQDQPRAIGRCLFEVAQTWRDTTLDGKDIPLTEMPLARALQGQRTERARSRVIRKDGSARLIEVDGVPIRDAAGQLIGGFIIFPDITERQQAEDLLRAQHDLALALTRAVGLDATLNVCLDALLRIAPMDSGGVFLVDEITHAVRLAVARGVSPEFARIGDSRGAGSTQAAMIQGGSPLYFTSDELDRVAPNSRREGLRLVAVLPIQHQGRVIGAINVASHERETIDPAARSTLEAIASQVGGAIAHAQAVDRLRESEERYRAFVANASEGIHRIDLSPPVPIDLPDEELVARVAEAAVIGEVNEALARLFGLRPDEVMGQPATRFAPDCGTRALELVRAPGYRVTNVVAIDRDDAGRAIHFRENTTAIVEDGCLVRVWGTKWDITELRRAEAERRRLEEQLRQAQKMEAIGRLAGGIAHDFNNIMTGINGYAEMVLESVGAGDPIRADLEEIRRAGERAAGLTNQLLAFSRKQVIAPRVIDPSEAIERSQSMLRRIIGEDIELSFRRSAAAGRIKADPAQVDQVLVNLAVNARDAMVDGGRLTIETANISLDEASCQGFRGGRAGEYVMLAVSDTGCGMDSETMTRIFEPFFTTKDKEKGTGLGLAMVYGIVQQNHGFINVYSEVGIGSTFKIYFPRVFEEPERIGAGVRRLPSGSETILLVEDEEMVRSLAARILERRGYVVLEAPDGGNAYLACTTHEGPIHLLLTDVVMPSMNGRELYTKLAAVRPDMKVLYMSGYTEDVIAHHGVLEPGTEFIQKPFTIDSLTRRVREVLDA